MTGIMGIVSKKNCASDLFYGTDYHSHLGTRTGGLAVLNGKGIHRSIKDISSEPFRPQLEEFRRETSGCSGIGVISDYEPQPLTVDSHLGKYAICHTGKINNLNSIILQAKRKEVHFLETSEGRANPVEALATLINKGKNFVEGLEIMQNEIKGSSSTMLLTREGIYLSRDRFGRTPVITGAKEDAFAATFESCALSNEGFKLDRFLGPGEIGILTKNGYEQLKKPGEELQICSFLWVYYGYPPSGYEGINVEVMRNRAGKIAAAVDKANGLEIDLVAGIPDSGTGHAIGYANEMKVDYGRPYIKYTPTWPRSFMPPNQRERERIAEMKLILIPEISQGKRIALIEDSIVRGTQLGKAILRLYNEGGAREVHMRPSCPPIVYVCRYLNFSSTKSASLLAARKAVRDITGRDDDRTMGPYLEEGSGKYEQMVDKVRERLHLTSLRYPRLDDMAESIGLPKKNLCTYCWTGKGTYCSAGKGTHCSKK